MADRKIAGLTTGTPTLSYLVPVQIANGSIEMQNAPISAILALDTGTSYTDEQAQDAAADAVADTATVSWAYNDGTNTLTATLVDGSVTFAKRANLSGQYKLVGRSSASAGVEQEISSSADVFSILTAANFAAIRAAQGLSSRSIHVVIDGAGSVITTGVKIDVEMPVSCTITGWRLLSDLTGSIVIDVWKDTYANFPPTVADTIAGSEKPTLSSVNKNQDTTLTTWTTAVSAGDILRFNVDSVATVTRVTLSLLVTI